MWGKLRQELDTQTSKIALEGLGGIKDLLILGRTSFFIDEYFKKNWKIAKFVKINIYMNFLQKSVANLEYAIEYFDCDLLV